jgi:hypothetical protein
LRPTGNQNFCGFEPDVAVREAVAAIFARAKELRSVKWALEFEIRQACETGQNQLGDNVFCTALK